MQYPIKPFATALAQDPLLAPTNGKTLLIALLGRGTSQTIRSLRAPFTRKHIEVDSIHIYIYIYLKILYVIYYILYLYTIYRYIIFIIYIYICNIYIVIIYNIYL